MDFVAFIAVVVSFALLVTVHVAIGVGLLLRSPWWRGAAALIVPPLAPYWSLEAGMKIRAALWVTALSAFVVARLLAG